ncbi:hypothetical protein [Kocuria palustris]|uniref:hypothetical protein n=1 Tax=Kocuria palustris TaxID=71999 RepID=UPI0011A81FFB|nr:hypothetical protein [Kocuria palustris]
MEARDCYEDRDADGFSDQREHRSVQSNYSESWTTDTDGDGVPDGVEYFGLSNAEWGADTVATATRSSSPDSDDDGLTDGQEIGRGINAQSTDSDVDGLADAAEGFNLVPDVAWFAKSLFIHTDPLLADQNRNGVPDGREFSLQWLPQA